MGSRFFMIVMEGTLQEKKNLLELLKSIVGDLESHNLAVRPQLLERIEQLEKELEEGDAE